MPELAQGTTLQGSQPASIDDVTNQISAIATDVKAITAVCDRILVLNYGERLAEGTAEQIQLDPAVIEAYLGAAPKGWDNA